MSRNMTYYKITNEHENEVAIAASDAASENTIEELLIILEEEGMISGWESYEMRIV